MVLALPPLGLAARLRAAALGVLLALAFLLWATESADTTGQKGQGCSLAREMRLGDSFTFRSFPPRAHVRSSSDSYFLQNGPFQQPRECTWSFKGQPDCVLEYRTEYYERADIDCNEQYLIIGDEYTEQRICGFGVPPRRLRSKGRELFLTHYQKNGNGNRKTMSSSLGGTVRCVQKRPTYSRVVYNGTATPEPPPCVWSQFICGLPHTFTCQNGPCTVNASIGLTAVSTITDSLSVICGADASSHCNGRFSQCGAALNGTCNALLPSLPIDTSHCQGAKVACPIGDHTCPFNITFSSNQVDIPSINDNCFSQPNERCAVAVVVCLENVGG